MRIYNFSGVQKNKLTEIIYLTQDEFYSIKIDYIS